MHELTLTADLVSLLSPEPLEGRLSEYMPGRSARCSAGPWAGSVQDDDVDDPAEILATSLGEKL